MTKLLSLAEAKDQLAHLPEWFVAHPDEGVIAVTRKGHPALAILSWSLYETLVETLEVMSDPDLWTQVQISAGELAMGKTVALEDVLRS